MLLDTGFTRADALRIAAMVLNSKKSLKTIYISQADPDYYFGIEVLKHYFPNANVVTTAPTRKKIEATLATKLQVWGPRMGANPPMPCRCLTCWPATPSAWKTRGWRSAGWRTACRTAVMFAFRRSGPLPVA